MSGSIQVPAAHREIAVGGRSNQRAGRRFPVPEFHRARRNGEVGTGRHVARHGRLIAFADIQLAGECKTRLQRRVEEDQGQHRHVDGSLEGADVVPGALVLDPLHLRRRARRRFQEQVRQPIISVVDGSPVYFEHVAELYPSTGPDGVNEQQVGTEVAVDADRRHLGTSARDGAVLRDGAIERAGGTTSWT